MTKRLLAILLLVPALASGQPGYTQEWKQHYSRLVSGALTFDPKIPLEPPVVSVSPRQYAAASLTRTDGAKLAYDKQVAHITITSRHFPPIHVETRFFRTVRASWVTDRLLLIERDIGHVARIEEVLDVVDRKWLSQQGVVHGPM